MIVLQGTGIVDAVAVGKLRFFDQNRGRIKKVPVQDTELEIQRYQQALSLAVGQMDHLYQQALQELGKENAMIFQAHKMMLIDVSYSEYVMGVIREQKVNAEYAVECAANYYSQILDEIPTPYMRERAADVRDISQRLQEILTGRTVQRFTTREPCVLAAADLLPSQTVQLDRSKILALVTQEGADYSHTAILARDMGIPAVIGTKELHPHFDGALAVVDGTEGRVYLDPDPQTLHALTEKMHRLQENRRHLEEMRGQPNRTRDGTEIAIYANIASPMDVQSVLRNDAGGIGLMRSEFLFLKSTTGYPTEEQQLAAYRYVVEQMGGRPVIIRTMDIGADKQVDYFELLHEENPAMGFRGIRICLERRELFLTQLRAILRASAYGPAALLYPMIISEEEIRQIRQLVQEAGRQLDAQNIPYDHNIRQGIMVETPAAALLSDRLARHVDFFSIGTNDLTQYTLAVDRQNPKVTRYYDPHHEAVLRLVEMTVKNAHSAGISVGICGELAGDLSLTRRFLEMGVDELSVSPAHILELRRQVRSLNLSSEK